MTDLTTFPLGQTIAQDELASRFVKQEDQPYGNLDLAYSIVLPNDWLQLGLEAQDAQLHADKPKLLANVLSPTDRDANGMIQVWCQGLIKEISAADWLKYYLTTTGREVGALQVVSPYFADAIAHWELDKVAYTMRIAACVAGNRLFLIQGMAPDDLYAEYAELFGLAVSSFKVTRKLENPHVELWQTHTLDDRIVCNAPISWPERTPEAPEGLSAVDLFNLSGEGEPLGVLKIMTLRKKLTEGKSGIDLPALLVMEFTKIGIEVETIASDEPLPVSEPFGNGSFKILTARVPKGDNRLRNLLIASFDVPSHHVLVGLMTCAPKEGFYEYAVNRRAFDIVLETMRVKDNSSAT